MGTVYSGRESAHHHMANCPDIAFTCYKGFKHTNHSSDDTMSHINSIIYNFV